MLLKRNLSALAVLMFLVATCVSAQAQSQGSAPSTANTEETILGSITGSVVNESGQPLAGAVVSVRQVNSGGPARFSTVDSEGNFRVNGLTAALYLISAFVPAYVSRPAEPNSPANYHRIGDSVRLELIRGGVITGTVTNAAGEPVIGVRVRASLTRDAEGKVLKIPYFASVDRTTDDRGNYRIFGLAPGTYLLSAGGSGPAQSLQLNPYDSDVPTYAPSSTRDNAAEIRVQSGEEVTADIRYRGEPGHTVSGTVKVTGTSGASVMLRAVGSGFAPVATVYQIPESRGFAVGGIGDGEYDLVAQEVTSNPTSQMPDLAFSEPRRVVVKGADVTGVDLVTRPLGSLSGRIALEPSKISECQGKRRPFFAEMLVVFQRPDKEIEKDAVPYVRLIAGSASPDAKGNFIVRNLVPGRYLLDPRFQGRYWYLDSIKIGAASKTDAAASWTNVKSGDQLTNLTITLTEGAASIRGRLAAANSAEVPSDSGVYLVPAEREKAADVLRFFVTTVNADGTFAFNNLPPGRYWSLVQTLDAQASTLSKLRLPEATEARTKLRRTAETQKTELELKPCQNLTDYQLKFQ